MAHNSITPADHGDYYEGDAIHIPFVIKNKYDDATIDITGYTVNFYLKESRTDSDTNAVLTKSGTEGGTTDGVTFTSPTTGEVRVEIATGDTDGVLTDDSGVRQESKEFFVAFRAEDPNGDRVTTVEATWVINAS